MTTTLPIPRRRPGGFLAAALVSLSIGTAHGQSITKCQDAEGNWHYGDFAAQACAEDATITEIDERGLKVKESDAPPTQDEVEAREAAEREKERKAERRAEQEMEDRRLLQTYDSPQAIVRARDQRVEALERDLESHRLFRQDLVDERQSLQDSGGVSERIDTLGRQIRQYDDAIESLENERQAIVEQYDKELERYRELTGE